MKTEEDLSRSQSIGGYGVLDSTPFNRIGILELKYVKIRHAEDR